ncbi:unnamed protein product [Protopolystoma xenopodis]|uniref:Uncharacterized protein n=1 Tax=Protopolystoma xenopodis TaxID=117903 RepID=A0A448WF52_9PLAT|nr:unnamed protein product [Protopolystoma xenopodis]
MSMLRDRDQIVQLTADNRSRLLDVLEHVASKTQLDKAIVRTLTTADLISAGGVDRCAAAAHQLDAIMGIKPLEG